MHTMDRYIRVLFGIHTLAGLKNVNRNIGNIVISRIII